jgi:putative ABC transport system permease protein
MLRLAWKTVRHNPKRLILTTVAIILATSFVSGTFVLTHTVQGSFDSMFSEIYGKSDIQVVPNDDNSKTAGFGLTVPSFDEAWVQRVAAVPGVAEVAPSTNGIVQMLNKQGVPVGQGAPVITLNWNQPPDLDNVTMTEGTYPTANDQIVLDVGGAKKAGYSIGDTVTVQRFGEADPFTFTLVGTATFGASNALNGATLAWFTYDEAQVIARQEGKVASISVGIADGYKVADVQAAIQQILPSDIVAKQSRDLIKESSKQVADTLNVINTFILAFALIAVFVGALLITNTFQTIVTQRTRELGLLRAIAASPRQVLTMILLEAVIVGLVGSVVGIGLGYALGGAAKLFLTAVAGIGANLGALTLPWPSVIWGLATGLGTTVVAAVFPAIHASEVSPMEALRDEANRKRKGLRRRTMLGAAFLLTSAVATALGFVTDVWNSAAWVGVGGALALIGTILIAAGLVAPLARWLRAPFGKVFGLNGRIAMNNAQREPRRTANTAGALMIGVLLLALLTTVSTSITSLAKKSLEGSSAASFIVGGDFTTDPGAPISDKDIAAMRAVKGVTDVHFRGSDTALIDGEPQSINAIDAQSAEGAYEYKVEPSFSHLTDGHIYVSSSVLAGGHKMGDTITIEGVDATRNFVISGTYLVEGDPGSDYWITFDDARTLHKGLAATSAWVAISDTADVATVQTALKEALAGDSRIQVSTIDDYTKKINQVFNQVLAMMSAMLSMALFIAVFGVANTLFLSVTERTREIGLIRAVGVKRSGIWAMITLESVFVSLLGAILGLVLGVVFGVALVQSFDIFREFGITIPWTHLIVYTILAVVAGIIAAIWPSWKASRLNILDAIATGE